MNSQDNKITLLILFFHRFKKQKTTRKSGFYFNLLQGMIVIVPLITLNFHASSRRKRGADDSQ